MTRKNISSAFMSTLFLFTAASFTNRSLAQPGEDVMKEAEKIVKVAVKPPFDFRFGIMEPGVLQHVDRSYTYDVVPEELLNGLLFQGIHRPPAGTVVSIELLAPATIYFFFHYKVDGGYSEIFEKMKDWERCVTAPQYDIHNGDHGLRMIMYRLEAAKGTYIIPPTVKDRACFSFVILKNE
jgi:hypothetical protein